MMVDEKQKDYEDRLTWKKGDLRVYGPDGKEVDVSTLKEEEDEDPLAAFPLDAPEEQGETAAQPPTVHLYIDPEDVQ